MIRRFCILALAALVALPIIAATKDAASKPAKPLRISKGAPINLADYLIAGKTTIFDFFSDYCGPCVHFAPELEKLHKTRDDIVVVIVDINRPGIKKIDWQSPVATQYKLHSIPHLKVFGPNGKLVAEDGEKGSKARDLVTGWLK